MEETFTKAYKYASLQDMATSMRRVIVTANLKVRKANRT